MQRQVCWYERVDDGIKREIRVMIHQKFIKWQFKLATDEHWDYTTPPSVDDWDTLLSRMEDRYRRRNVSFDDLELVRRLRGEARGGD